MRDAGQQPRPPPVAEKGRGSWRSGRNSSAPQAEFEFRAPQEGRSGLNRNTFILSSRSQKPTFVNTRKVLILRAFFVFECFIFLFRNNKIKKEPSSRGLLFLQKVLYQCKTFAFNKINVKPVIISGTFFHQNNLINIYAFSKLQ